MHGSILLFYNFELGLVAWLECTMPLATISIDNFSETDSYTPGFTGMSHAPWSTSVH